MPVLSPRRSSSSALNGSYRNTYSTSNLDRPYYGSNRYSPRINSYSERFTTRSYIDNDGRKVFARQGSITEDGVTTRFKEELREPSVRRDSLTWGGDSVRENSVFDGLPGRYERENSLTRSISREGTGCSSRPPLSAISVAESVAELHKKYSPDNYVPACRRKNEIMSRSKSINDIGKPPLIESIDTTTNTTKKVINNGVNCNNGLLSVYNSTNNGCNDDDDDKVSKDDNARLLEEEGEEDDNGNRASVAEICKKFDKKKKEKNGLENGYKNGDETMENEPMAGVKISENRFKKLDTEENNKTKTKTIIKKPEDKTTSKTIKTSETAPSKIKSLRTKTEKALLTNGTASEKKVVGTKKGAAAAGAGAGTTTVATSLKKKQNQENVDSKIDSSPCMPENGSKSKLGEVSDVVNDDGVELGGGKSNLGLSINTRTVVPLLRKENNVSGTCEHPNTIEREEEEVKKKEDDKGKKGDQEEEEEEDENGKNGRTSNFASYIPSDELVKVDGDSSTHDSSELDDISSNDMEGRHVFSDSSRYILHNDSTSSLERHHRGVGGGRDHLDGYGRPLASPLSSLSGVGSALTARNAGLNGLKNIGNTCFMNSVLQCMSNTRPLLEYVKNDAYLNDINVTISSMKGALIKAFAHVIKELWSEDLSERAVNTLALKSQIQRFAPRFMGYAQQDAQEFLRYLLEGLHEDVNRVTTKPKPIHTEIDEKLSDSEKSAESWRRYLRMDNSKIVDIFVGQLKSTLRCTHCGHCSVTFDPFWDLSLPIPQRAGPLRLQQCLESFTRVETLDGDEMPTCSKCKERRKCTKSFSIQKFPKILVIHLKRFSPTERYRGKLSLTIDFPMEGLDMQNYAADGSNGDSRYNLYAISNHSGTTYSGHYTAYCRHPYTHSWHEYNDSRVSSISSKALVSGEAYVLFYELENQKSHL